VRIRRKGGVTLGIGAPAVEHDFWCPRTRQDCLRQKVVKRLEKVWVSERSRTAAVH
jgi:hypothetical protein